MPVAAPRETRRRSVHGDREEGGPDGLVADHAPELVAPQPRASARAVDRDDRGAERGRALRHLDRHDRAHVHAVPPQDLGEVAEAQVEAPIEVRRPGRELVADRLELGHVPRGEDGAGILGVAAARRVIEGREELALPQEHPPGGGAHRLPDRRGRGHAPGVHLVGRRGHDVVGLAGLQRAVVRGVGARDDRLGAERLERPALARLRPQHADHVVLERQLVDDRHAVAAPHELERRRVLPAVQPDRVPAREPEGRGAPAVDLDVLPARAGPHDVGAPDEARRAGVAAAELGHLDVRPPQLGGARALHQRHADRVGGRGRGGAEEERGEGREGARHRRPTIQRMSDRTALRTSEVARGK